MSAALVAPSTPNIVNRPARRPAREERVLVIIAAALCSMPAAGLLAMNRLRTGEKSIENVVGPHIVHLLKRPVRDIRHDREFLVAVRQELEELDQVFHARDAVVLT